MLCLRRPESIPTTEWNTSIRELALSQADQFEACGYAVKDADVAPAHLLELKYTSHPNDAILSIWVEHAHSLDSFFNAVRELGEFQAYGVMESSAIPFEMEHGRVTGMCQVAFIKKPSTQARTEWLDAWLGDHTRVATETQSNFGYRQNVIAVPMPLKQRSSKDSSSWPLMDAIVEENFPTIAMTSREAFFDAEGDAERFEAHQQSMMQSCSKFIDFEVFDCVPMSQYVIKTA